MIKTILENGFLTMVPVFIWNIVFISRLPEAFGAKNMDTGIPRGILTAENVLRAAVFILPLFFRLDVTTAAGRAGFAVYIAGCLIYFVSWLLVIYAPHSRWSKSVFGFAAAAYTPIVWLIGISMMAGSYNVGIPFARWHYIILSIVFTGVHTAHSVLAYLRRNDILTDGQ